MRAIKGLLSVAAALAITACGSNEENVYEPYTETSLVDDNSNVATVMPFVEGEERLSDEEFLHSFKEIVATVKRYRHSEDFSHQMHIDSFYDLEYLRVDNFLFKGSLGYMDIIGGLRGDIRDTMSSYSASDSASAQSALEKALANIDALDTHLKEIQREYDNGTYVIYYGDPAP